MEKNTEDTNIVVKSKRISKKKAVKTTIIFLIALLSGYLHYKHVAYLFDLSTNFSYLSELEREMYFTSEQAFYYSYYKTIVEEKQFMYGVSKVMYDKLVEYPDEVNAFSRFNIHPEVALGTLFRYLEPWLQPTRRCHIVDRGDLAPVESCNGAGEPMLFYIGALHVLAGVGVGFMALHAGRLSNTILGTLMALAQYAANHSELTRVMWMPNVRENVSWHLLTLQAWLLSEQLRGARQLTLQIIICFVNSLCLLSWQFTQFIFLTQLTIFFVMEQLKIINLKTLCVVLHSHFCGLHMTLLFMQGNEMLKSSLYISLFGVLSVYCVFFGNLRVNIKNKRDFVIEALLVVLRVCLVGVLSLYIKRVVSDLLGAEEDDHVWGILLSKISDYKTFHTLMYTSSSVFGFLPWSSYLVLIKSLLIPIVIIVKILVVAYWFNHAFKAFLKYKKIKIQKLGKDNEEENDSGIDNNAEREKDLDPIDKNDEVVDGFVVFLRHLKVDAAVFYQISQMVVYGVMAALVMRLKSLWVPQMCIVSSLIMNPKYFIHPRSMKRYVLVLWAVCAAVVLNRASDMLAQERSVVGEFSNPDLEMMLQWIRRQSPVTAAFAGSLSVLPAVMLSGRRPIVAHPHYEHAAARARVYATMKVYGRFSSEELYRELTKLRASYLIVEYSLCYQTTDRGVTMQQIWSQVAEQSGRVLCHRLLTGPVDHFYQLYRDDSYAVFRVHDYSVSYMPRSFDT